GASGADFHDPSVDPLATPGPLPLLPPEELPPIQFTNVLSAVISGSNLIPTVSGTVFGVVEEEALNHEVIPQDLHVDFGNGNEDTFDKTSNPAIPGSGLDQDTS